mmetsp:Transcript_50472/g.93286  ORF Transcript_50472/g.93286 Transcript_50472/m.93286 type:complete len:345 (-) Transcript_50472:345-1379(-)
MVGWTNLMKKRRAMTQSWRWMITPSTTETDAADTNEPRKIEAMMITTMKKTSETMTTPKDLTWITPITFMMTMTMVEGLQRRRRAAVWCPPLTATTSDTTKTRTISTLSMTTAATRSTAAKDSAKRRTMMMTMVELQRKMRAGITCPPLSVTTSDTVKTRTTGALSAMTTATTSTVVLMPKHFPKRRAMMWKVGVTCPPLSATTWDTTKTRTTATLFTMTTATRSMAAKMTTSQRSVPYRRACWARGSTMTFASPVRMAPMKVRNTPHTTATLSATTKATTSTAATWCGAGGTTTALAAQVLTEMRKRATTTATLSAVTKAPMSTVATTTTTSSQSVADGGTKK